MYEQLYTERLLKMPLMHYTHTRETTQTKHLIGGRHEGRGQVRFMYSMAAHCDLYIG